MAINPEEIKAEIDDAIRSSPPAPPRSNTAASFRTILKKVVDWIVEQNYTPEHSWVGTALRFIRADGTPGDLVDLKGAKGDTGYKGWSPVLSNVVDGQRIVQQVTDWVGGEGAKPAVTPALYVSATGYTATIANAIDIRGGLGINWRGDWLGGTVYAANDGVYTGGNSYVRKTAGTARATFDATEAASWSLVALGGQPADRTVTAVKLEQSLANLVQVVDDSLGYAYVIIGAQYRRVFAIRTDGLIQGKFDLSLSSVPLSALPASVQQAYSSLDTDVSGYAYVITDANGRIGFGIKKDGSVVGKLTPMANSITEAMLTAAVQAKLNNAQIPAAFTRLNAANAWDVDTDDDDYWRGVSASLDLKTEVSGYAFTRFPSTVVRSIRGMNTTGTTLQFRQAYNLAIHGRRYRGTYNPASAGLTLTTHKGTYGNSYSNSYPAFTVGTVGDFWVANVAGTNTVTANGLTFKNGDLIVQTGASTYAVQPGPGDGSFQEGDFWNVTAAGKYADLSLVVTQRLVYIGAMSQSGPKYVQFVPSIAGEFFVMGEVTSSSFSPVVAAQNGDVYIFAGSYTTQGVSGVEGDYLVYENGWGLVPGNVKEFAANAYVVLEADNANRWEVRRKDKSTTQVNVSLNTFRSTVRRRSSDDVVLISDSMFGAGGNGSTIVANLTAAGRTAAYYSYGGGTSNDILAMLKKFIRTGVSTSGIDPFAGRLHVIWHAQNNQYDLNQAKNAALQMAALVGMKQKKYVFWSILGQITPSFNGSRIVIGLHEDANAGANHIAQLEQWYALMFPKQWYNPRKAALALTAARTTIPHLLFPGMSEAQVAATYGIPALSFWLDYSQLPTAGLGLSFAGYYATAGLPSGGTANDYYIRTGGGTVGNLLVNVAGTWTEFAYDITHPNTLGGNALANDFYTNFIVANNL